MSALSPREALKLYFPGARICANEDGSYAFAVVGDGTEVAISVGDNGTVAASRHSLRLTSVGPVSFGATPEEALRDLVGSAR